MIKSLKKSILPFVTAALLLVSATSHGQAISTADKKKLRAKEDSLRLYAQFLVTDTLPEDRMYSDSIFTRTLVRALQVKNSFYYPFDSVFGISKLYAPDSSFRIFTWTLEYDDFYNRQRGAIQFPTKDGSLRLVSLRDYSEFTDKPEDSIRTRHNWIGAVYYNIVKKVHNGKNYYTLFGYDHNNVRSAKKWIEVLTFDDKKEPIFGAAPFTFEDIKKPPKHRISLEYKKEARVLMDYVSDLGLILMDHLISETDEPEFGFTMVPDGDNEAFKWENGKWVHVDKAFEFQIDMTGADPLLGRPPVGDPILDRKGNENEKKLEEKSKKNKGKENQ